MKRLPTQTVYKVVDRVDGKLLSGFVACVEKNRKRRRFTCEYAIGKRTYPRPGTRLFAFTDKEQALAYAKLMSNKMRNCEVYEAQATSVKETGWFGYYMHFSVKYVVDAFKQEQFDKPDAEYNSTVTCTSITLTAKVG